MSLLPRTNPLGVCPACGGIHPAGQPPCPAPPDSSPGSRPTPQAQPRPRAGIEDQALPLSAEPTPAKPAARPLSDEKIRSLVDQGIIVDEDVHGLRLTGKPVGGRGKGTGQLSASDIVRLAADLDGGVLPADQRRHCPHCSAVMSPRASRCEWCGKSLTPPST